MLVLPSPGAGAGALSSIVASLPSVPLVTAGRAGVAAADTGGAVLPSRRQSALPPGVVAGVLSAVAMGDVGTGTTPSWLSAAIPTEGVEAVEVAVEVVVVVVVVAAAAAEMAPPLRVRWLSFSLRQL